MPTIDHLDNFADVQNTYLLRDTPGVVFHAMLFPGCYPGDMDSTAEQFADPYIPPDLDEGYNNYSRKFLAAEAIVQRLGIVSDPNAPRVLIQQRNYAELQAVGREEVRVAWFDQFVRGLLEVCGDTSPFVQTYLRGVEKIDPKASFWATFPLAINPEGNGWQHPGVVVMMHYQNRTFEGFDISTGDFTTDMLRYIKYCRAVFEDAQCSINIAELSQYQDTPTGRHYDWYHGSWVNPVSGGATY